ncbi:MFS transporter [Advenella kashmirensis W13003]|uniref:MFS transporter n=1 Tax=Advenella kashmirensis W13003 TaxID=1424334 RepID=V8QVJ4_9BURK|nr:tripartite tricarboxylate transporter substrate-binding protein [Advenella kashmirensis]ETF03009.1 MFS transporter [Advenella kashmirensis W13003]
MTRQSILAHTKGIVFGLAAVLGSAASAQNFPTKPITVIVPYTVGGSSDVIARLVTQGMSEPLGQSVVVDNRAGAGGTIGTGLAARKGQGGYHLLMADNAQAVIPATYKKLNYDPVADFSMVGYVGEAPVMLFASGTSGIKSLEDLLTKARAQPGKITIGTGYGSPSHLMTELLQKKAGIELQIVPYKGAAAALTDMIAGHIDLVLSNSASGASYLSTDKAVVLAQSGSSRDPRFSKVPTFSEGGVPGFDVQYWFALLAPSDTPAPALQTLRGAMKKALVDPELSRKLYELGINKATSDADSMSSIKDEADLWKKVVIDSSISIN